MKPKSEVDPETGAMDPDSTEAHACVVAEVEVDTETGEVEVLSLKCVYEIGRAVNPKLVEGQIVGGAVMGLAHALYDRSLLPERGAQALQLDRIRPTRSSRSAAHRGADTGVSLQQRAIRRQGRG